MSDYTEILRGEGIEIILKHESDETHDWPGIQYGFRGQGLTSEYDFWRGDRESLLHCLLDGLGLTVRGNRIVSE